MPPDEQRWRPAEGAVHAAIPPAHGTMLRRGSRSIVSTLCGEVGLPLEMLASATGVTVAALRRIDRGRERPRLATAMRLAAVLGVDVDALFPLQHRADGRRDAAAALVQRAKGGTSSATSAVSTAASPATRPADMQLRNSILSRMFRSGLTDGGLARSAGLTQAQLNRIRNGRVSPRLETAMRLAVALRCGVSDLFWLERPRGVKRPPR